MTDVNVGSSTHQTYTTGKSDTLSPPSKPRLKFSSSNLVRVPRLASDYYEGRGFPSRPATAGARGRTEISSLSREVNGIDALLPDVSAALKAVRRAQGAASREWSPVRARALSHTASSPSLSTSSPSLSAARLGGAFSTGEFPPYADAAELPEEYAIFGLNASRQPLEVGDPTGSGLVARAFPPTRPPSRSEVHQLAAALEQMLTRAGTRTSLALQAWQP